MSFDDLNIPMLQNQFHDDYTLGHEIGSGGTATVYLSLNFADEPFAVKLLRKTKMKGSRLKGLFQEVSILRRLNHRNIVRFINIYDEPEAYYLVFENISGGELFDRIAKKKFYSEDQARDLAKVLLHAIKYCHDMDIVHRDLKPENLMFTSDAEDADLKLIDFGFAAANVHGNELSEILGTKPYLSPEMVSKQLYGKPVDMWAFGVIVYVLLAGYLPFEAPDDKILFNNIKQGNFYFHSAYWSQVSESAKDLICGLLTTNPDRRLTVDQALRHHWIQTPNQTLHYAELYGGAKNIPGQNLNQVIANIHRLQIRKKFRAAVQACIAVDRFRKALITRPRTSNQNLNNLVGSPNPNPPPVNQPLNSPRHQDQLQQSKLGHHHSSSVHSLPTIGIYHYFTSDKLQENKYFSIHPGFNKANNQEVFVKIIKRNLIKPITYQRFLKEYHMIHSFDHPNIIKYYDLYEHSDLLKTYLIQEKVYGEELFERIARRMQYTEREAKEIARNILSVIKFLHDRNLIHRDLKPENFRFINDSNDAALKLISFSLLTSLDNWKNGLIQNTQLCGTLGYLSPEMIRGNPYGKPIDLWSFGVILFEILAGYPPFYHENEDEIYQMINEGRFVFHDLYWKDISSEAKDLLSNLFKLDPNIRYTVDQALAHPWFQLQDEFLSQRSLATGLNNLKSFCSTRKNSHLLSKRMSSITHHPQTFHSQHSSLFLAGNVIPPAPSAAALALLQQDSEMMMSVVDDNSESLSPPPPPPPPRYFTSISDFEEIEDPDL